MVISMGYQRAKKNYGVACFLLEGELYVLFFSLLVCFFFLSYIYFLRMSSVSDIVYNVVV